jgi:MYXO-CTERM domain-containing protein
MKLKTALAAALIAMASKASAAIYSISNLNSGYGYSDALVQLENGTLSSGGIVAMGYFTGTPSGDLALINTTIADFTILASALTGSYSGNLGGSFDGYVDTVVQGAAIVAPNALIGKSLYAFVGNASTLSSSTQWALVQVAAGMFDESEDESTYVFQPYGISPIIGTIGSYIGNASGLASSSESYTTLKLVSAVPEPTAALLGSLGALGLLRRRRNA